MLDVRQDNFQDIEFTLPSFKKSIQLDSRRGLNRVLSAKAGPCTVQNPHAIYVAQFTTDCPYSGDVEEGMVLFQTGYQ